MFSCRLFKSKKINHEVQTCAKIPNAYSDSSYSKQEGDCYMSNPLINLTEIELRDLCRHHIDTYENWSRRIIDETLKDKYGSDYFDCMISDKNPLIKSEIKKRIEKRIKDNPRRFPRKIDAILLEDIEYLICRDDLYSSLFKTILEPFYSGKGEIRKVMNRLIPIRNKLSHGNTISIHEAEQCICYTDDFINVYKQHYLAIGKEKIYNVPIFMRIKDSLGNDIIRDNSKYSWDISFEGIIYPQINFRSGESYKIWVEVDSSFDSSFYDVSWTVKQDYSTIIKKGKGNTIEFTFNNTNVSFEPTIEFVLVTKREWHRFHDVDDKIRISYGEVFPPIEDTY